MSKQLPEAIEAYFRSENAHDPEALDACFRRDGVVRDEGGLVEGLAAIKAWRVDTAVKYAHAVEPLGLGERDGRILVTARVSGRFPGSPICLDHIFDLQDGRIASLEIR